MTVILLEISWLVNSCCWSSLHMIFFPLNVCCVSAFMICMNMWVSVQLPTMTHSLHICHLAIMLYSTVHRPAEHQTLTDFIFFFFFLSLKSHPNSKSTKTMTAMNHDCYNNYNHPLFSSLRVQPCWQMVCCLNKHEFFIIVRGPVTK